MVHEFTIGHDEQLDARKYALFVDVVNADLSDEEIEALEQMIHAFRSTKIWPQ